MTTIRDVARLSGVSVTTVSVIINGKAEERGITKKTQDKVLAAMKELSYQPNLSARKLRNQDPAKPTIAFYWPLDYRTPILASFLDELQKAIKMQNFQCELIVQTYEYGNLMRDATAIINNSYNSVVIGGASKNDFEFLESITPKMPIVLINRESKKYSTVNTDPQEIGMKAAQLFYNKGYTEVAVIASNEPYVATSLRTQAFLTACTQLGINVNPEYIIQGYSSVAGGNAAAEVFCKLKNPPRAIFFESDSMAIGALHSFHKNGKRTPEDIEILAIGMLDSEFTSLCIPSLSVIELPNSKISQLIMEILSEKIQSNDMSPIHFKVEAEVILRESFSV